MNKNLYTILALCVATIWMFCVAYTNYSRKCEYKKAVDSLTTVCNREKEISETYRQIDSIMWINYRNHLDEIEPSRLDSTVTLHDKLSRLYK